MGESGLSVFHAGHWLWQRPHSVQVVKSRMPFQEKSSTAPTPSLVSSSISSRSSKSTGLPPEVIGARPPSAVRPVAWRLKKMLKKARKRCQATPMVGCSEIVIIQAKEMTILSVATTQIRLASVVCERPLKASPSQKVSGKWKALA